LNPKRVVVIIQARMGSSRLPGKVLADIQGEPMLTWVVERCRLASRVNEVIVATSSDSRDDPIVSFCEQQGYPVLRGNESDVLDRYHQAANLYKAEVIVRITGDCPFIDPDLIDEAVKAILESKPPVDLVVNRLPWERTYPIGLDVEVCIEEALETAWFEAQEAHQRQHVMPFIYEHPERFSILQLNADKDYGAMRWTVDTIEDLQFVRQVASLLGERECFRWRDVLQVLDAHPNLQEINAEVNHKTHRDVE
jgi:spore coat polysaccharide biosynthesis protein SpsF